MVELIALSVVVVVGVMAILYAVPRYLGGAETDASGPDVLDSLDRLANATLSKPRSVDFGLGLVALVLLGLTVAAYRDPGLLGGVPGQAETIAIILGVVGLAALFGGTYLNVRRGGVYSAEATLVGMSLVGLVFLLLIAVRLLEA